MTMKETSTSCTTHSLPRLGMIFLKIRSEMKATKAVSKLKATTIQVVSTRAVVGAGFRSVSTKPAKTRHKADTIFSGVSLIFKALLFKLLLLPGGLLVGFVSCRRSYRCSMFFLMKSTFKIGIVLTFLIVYRASNRLLFFIRSFIYEHLRWQRYNRDFLPDQLLYFFNVIFFSRCTESQGIPCR